MSLAATAPDVFPPALRLLPAESDMPLWPAGLLYLQLMAEPLSRVQACPPVTEGEKKDVDYGQADLLGFPRHQWRKSSQW